MTEGRKHTVRGISLKKLRLRLRRLKRRKRLVRDVVYRLYGPQMRTVMRLKYDHRFTSADGRRFVTFQIVERKRPSSAG